MENIQAYVLNFATATLVFFVGKFFARYVSQIAISLLQKSKIEPTIIKFFESILYVVLLILVALVALDQLGVNTTSFIAVLGAAGLAIGLALQGTLSNVAAGVFLIIVRPFKVGDIVDLAGSIGEVEQISIFTTNLNTEDGKKIIIPNNQILTNKIVILPQVQHKD